MATNLRVETGHYEEVSDADTCFVPTGESILNGPQAVLASDVWSILQDKIGSISRFRGEREQDVIQIAEGIPALRLSVHQLLITREERDRFEAECELSIADTGNKQPPIFTHNSSYSEVTLRGERFTFGAAQAGVIRELHAAYLRGEVWLNQREMLTRCAQSTRLVDLFKSKPNWRSLVEFDQRGSCRLNLPEQQPPRNRRAAFRRAVSHRKATSIIEAVDKAS